MTQDRPTRPIIVLAAREIVSETDALAAATDRSRNYIVNQALRQYLETNARQIERIKAGIAAARDGRVRRPRTYSPTLRPSMAGIVDAARRRRAGRGRRRRGWLPDRVCRFEGAPALLR